MKPRASFVVVCAHTDGYAKSVHRTGAVSQTWNQLTGSAKRGHSIKLSQTMSAYFAVESALLRLASAARRWEPQRQQGATEYGLDGCSVSPWSVSGGRRVNISNGNAYDAVTCGGE